MKLQKLILISLLLSFGAKATVEEDLKKDIKITAASQEVDVKEGKSILYGPVTVTQGTIKILADRIEIIDSKDGAKFLIATGKPASYSQLMDNGKIATAKASEINYDMTKRILTLKGNSNLEQEGNSVNGDLIKYNMQTQQLLAESDSGRVITVIKPDTYKKEDK